MSHLNDLEFTNNPARRCACVLLLDTSTSMQGPRINALNAGIAVLRDELSKDTQALVSVDLAIVTFDSDVTVVRDFGTVDDFEPPRLTARGATRLGAGLQKALDMIEARRQTYADRGVPCYRPWLMLLTDGEPQGESQEVLDRAQQRVQDAQRKGTTLVFAIGVGDDVDLAHIATITGTDARRLAGLKFQELFTWLSVSMSRVSGSAIGTQVELPSISSWDAAAT